MRTKEVFLFLFFLGLILIPCAASAENVGDIVSFNVDNNFDSAQRNQLQAVLVKIGNNIYFYIEKSWWDLKNYTEKTEILNGLDSLSVEFDSKIYSTLTGHFGQEQKPGIDRDNKITVLFESMNNNEGGYFKEADEYDRLQVPSSNEREMIYLSLDYINSAQLKTILAHEFVHLITFNQKNKIYGTEEDVWLNEARADFASAVLEYDIPYEGSNLQARIKDFIQNPSDSLVEWSGAKYDYATDN